MLQAGNGNGTCRNAKMNPKGWRRKPSGVLALNPERPISENGWSRREPDQASPPPTNPRADWQARQLTPLRHVWYHRDDLRAAQAFWAARVYLGEE